MASILALSAALTSISVCADSVPDPKDFQDWRLPDVAPAPTDNAVTPDRVALGKRLFFDTKLSGDGDMACSTCHDPRHGWSDGLPTAKGHQGKILPRSTPTVANSGFNALQMWDGRFGTLEEQALGPMGSEDEMHGNLDAIVAYLRSDPSYVAAFWKAYPGETVDAKVLGKAVASFERTVVINTTRFDRWLSGDKTALNAAELRGLQIFMDPAKGNCQVCHAAPNFSDSGFHNIGLASYGKDNPDLGRYAKRKVALMKGAFKTPGLRGVPGKAPYFHDGSAATLADVVKHYVRGGDVKTNLSPNLKTLTLTDDEQSDLVAFLNSLAATPDSTNTASAAH